MKKCVICRNEILHENPAVFFVDDDGINKEICSNCENQIDIMMESEDINKTKSAINYLYTCYLSNGDEEVKQVLKSALDENSKEIIDKEKEIESNNPVDNTKIVDYFSENNNINSTDISGWISILKITSWIYMALLLITSLIYVFTSGGLGIIAFLVILLTVLIFIAIIKIIVNMSEEVTVIKKMLIRIKNKDEKHYR